MAINELTVISDEVVETARITLVIGALSGQISRHLSIKATPFKFKGLRGADYNGGIKAGFCFLPCPEKRILCT